MGTHTFRNTFWAVAVVVGVSGSALQAAQVLKVSTSRKLVAVGGLPTSAWRQKDQGCIERDPSNRACGMVVRVLPKGIIFSVPANHDLNRGDSVTVRKGSGTTTGSRRAVASGGSSRMEARGGRSGGPRNNLFAGANFLQPVVGYERALGSHWALGLMPTYMNFSSTDGKLSGIGGFATLSYYSKQPFKGFWGMVGGGYYSFTASLGTLEETASSLSFLGGVGYRWLFRSGLNLGILGGGQYLMTSQTESLTFSSFLPAVMAQLGYSF